LTGAKYFLTRTWILWYPTEDIVPDLEEAYESIGRLPVVLMVDEGLFRTVYEEEKPEIKRQEEEIYQFMQNHGYSRVVEKDDYEIWVPAG
jgi:hypothetical protein